MEIGSTFTLKGNLLNSSSFQSSLWGWQVYRSRPFFIPRFLLSLRSQLVFSPLLDSTIATRRCLRRKIAAQYCSRVYWLLLSLDLRRSEKAASHCRATSRSSSGLSSGVALAFSQRMYLVNKLTTSAKWMQLFLWTCSGSSWRGTSPRLDLRFSQICLTFIRQQRWCSVWQVRGSSALSASGGWTRSKALKVSSSSRTSCSKAGQSTQPVPSGSQNDHSSRNSSMGLSPSSLAACSSNSQTLVRKTSPQTRLSRTTSVRTWRQPTQDRWSPKEQTLLRKAKKLGSCSQQRMCSTEMQDSKAKMMIETMKLLSKQQNSLFRNCLVHSRIRWYFIATQNFFIRSRAKNPITQKLPRQNTNRSQTTRTPRSSSRQQFLKKFRFKAPRSRRCSTWATSHSALLTVDSSSTLLSPTSQTEQMTIRASHTAKKNTQKYHFFVNLDSWSTRRYFSWGRLVLRGLDRKASWIASQLCSKVLLQTNQTWLLTRSKAQLTRENTMNLARRKKLESNSSTDATALPGCSYAISAQKRLRPSLCRTDMPAPRLEGSETLMSLQPRTGVRFSQTTNSEGQQACTYSVYMTRRRKQQTSWRRANFSILLQSQLTMLKYLSFRQDIRSTRRHLNPSSSALPGPITTPPVASTFSTRLQKNQGPRPLHPTPSTQWPSTCTARVTIVQSQKQAKKTRSRATRAVLPTVIRSTTTANWARGSSSQSTLAYLFLHRTLNSLSTVRTQLLRVTTFVQTRFLLLSYSASIRIIKLRQLYSGSTSSSRPEAASASSRGSTVEEEACSTSPLRTKNSPATKPTVTATSSTEPTNRRKQFQRATRSWSEPFWRMSLYVSGRFPPIAQLTIISSLQREGNELTWKVTSSNTTQAEKKKKSLQAKTRRKPMAESTLRPQLLMAGSSSQPKSRTPEKQRTEGRKQLFRPTILISRKIKTVISQSKSRQSLSCLRSTQRSRYAKSKSSRRVRATGRISWQPSLTACMSSRQQASRRRQAVSSAAKKKAESVRRTRKAVSYWSALSPDSLCSKSRRLRKGRGRGSQGGRSSDQLLSWRYFIMQMPMRKQTWNTLYSKKKMTRVTRRKKVETWLLACSCMQSRSYSPLTTAQAASQRLVARQPSRLAWPVQSRLKQTPKGKRKTTQLMRVSRQGTQLSSSRKPSLRSDRQGDICTSSSTARVSFTNTPIRKGLNPTIASTSTRKLDRLLSLRKRECRCSKAPKASTITNTSAITSAMKMPRKALSSRPRMKQSSQSMVPMRRRPASQTRMRGQERASFSQKEADEVSCRIELLRFRAQGWACLRAPTLFR